MSNKVYLLKRSFLDLDFYVQHDGIFQRFEWQQFQPLCFQNALTLYNGLRARAGMLRNVMGKTGPGQSNLLIKQEIHPGIDGTLQGAAVSDLLWGNSSVLRMCSHAKVSWRVFELIPSCSSFSSLHFTPRLWSTQWCYFKKYALSFLHLPRHRKFYTLTSILVILQNYTCEKVDISVFLWNIAASIWDTYCAH